MAWSMRNMQKKEAFELESWKALEKRDLPPESGNVDTCVSVLPRPFLQGATPCPFFVTPCLFKKVKWRPAFFF